jgi:hypothetical protein
MAVSTPSKHWHIANWTGLGWLETGLKLVALAAGILALYRALTSGTFITPAGTRLIEVVLVALLALALTAGIVDRYIEREIIAMGFVLVNNLGHWGMVVALFTRPGPNKLLIIFALFMLLGDIVKIIFLLRTKFTVRGLPTALLVRLTSFFVISYAILLILALLPR